MVFNCCVNGCNNYNKDAQMHIFPKDQILYDIWINAIGREDLKVKPMERVRKSYRICTIHFSAEARYVGTRNKSTLKQDAIPSLFLNASNRKEVSSAKMVKLRSKHSLSEQIGSPEVETVNISIPSTSKLICEEVLPVSSSKLITPEQNMQSQVMMCTPTKISSKFFCKINDKRYID
ncbi:52 kDa repressor of the inhibitor of the protein kinase-like [Diorhabda carinulata]|uniref:52 kDa repressor of the inhibitor of the protein kinase-like n=1 Tax=Diorhabda carinulata TaxID=1163345 RepID=UPI0025A1B499|nr:52 kDa repressor of the inhibitor of the protein kinase-like [Diorhabda carinulata]